MWIFYAKNRPIYGLHISRAMCVMHTKIAVLAFGRFSVRRLKELYFSNETGYPHKNSAVSNRGLKLQNPE